MIGVFIDLDVKPDLVPDLVPGLVPGIQFWKSPGSLGQDKSLKFMTNDSIFFCDGRTVLSPVVTSRFSPVFSGCFVFLVRCSAAHTPSHVWRHVCTFMHPPAPCQRIGPVVLHVPWNHRENLWESFVMSLFVRSTVCSSVLVLKMSCAAVSSAHKSWTPWLWRPTPLLLPPVKPYSDVGKTK